MEMSKALKTCLITMSLKTKQALKEYIIDRGFLTEKLYFLNTKVKTTPFLSKNVSFFPFSAIAFDEKMFTKFIPYLVVINFELIYYETTN